MGSRAIIYVRDDLPDLSKRLEWCARYCEDKTYEILAIATVHKRLAGLKDALEMIYDHLADIIVVPELSEVPSGLRRDARLYIEAVRGVPQWAPHGKAARIVAMYREGTSMEDISYELDISVRRITAALQRMGIARER